MAAIVTHTPIRLTMPEFPEWDGLLGVVSLIESEVHDGEREYHAYITKRDGESTQMWLRPGAFEVLE